ncbi:hypothetical protein [Clostridium disporicum]|uniref:Uncharacterized protein n=1 Tax=Clostridium disporicum TaxID=84024 RepID=A0A174DAT7_9CLOT|nr:hypothetical protein [Clostridium disporicum]CUO22654.1 Uncharacterised protein [Clostridium disporicum]
MEKYIKILKLLIFTCTLFIGINLCQLYPEAYSPEEGQKIEAFIDKNEDLLSSEEKDNLSEIINKLNKYVVLSQEEREYIRECELNVIRKKLGDAQFEEYKKLIEKRASGSEFQQPERFRLYELEKMLR